MPSSITFDETQKEIISQIRSLRDDNEAINCWMCPDAEPIRRAIKAFGIKTQSRRCCYCKEKINSNNFKMWEVEHILPQSKFPDFVFEPENLAISCPDCNTAKSNQKISKSDQYRRFPKKSVSYLIIHPHFDVYENHILKSGFVFVPKSSKGTKTIFVCSLHRFAEKFINWEEPEEVSQIVRDVDHIQSTGGDPEMIRSIMRRLADLV